MKKLLWFAFGAIVVAVLIATAFIERDLYNYPIGRDTVTSYGDREFQVAQIQKHHLLSNEKYHVIVIDQLVSREIVHNYAYFLGTDGGGTRVYGVLSVEENVIELFWEDPVDRSYQDNLEEMVKEGAAVIHTEFTAFRGEDQTILQQMEENLRTG
ncbi:MAG: hypothetical protein IJA48_02120 [Oscillospiraceae bacterium]|nr:hypothetical protein [Oscillospiraceae bacterium]